MAVHRAQDRIRLLHQDLMKQACSVCPMPRLCEYLVLGLGSKNTKTRIEVVEVRSKAPFQYLLDRQLCDGNDENLS